MSCMPPYFANPIWMSSAVLKAEVSQAKVNVSKKASFHKNDTHMFQKGRGSAALYQVR